MSDSFSLLTGAEIDAIGEILNISMGSAATAVSTMLDKQVVITTPKVMQQKFGSINYAMLEPAMLVKIKYVQGISGSNVMVFRQRDMQVILNLLMGNEEEPSDDFIFDELSMSAACEVMNQMMGASATALSEFLGKTINISTPEATVLDDAHTFEAAMEVDDEESIVSVAFNLNIEGVMNSDFISVLTLDLAHMIVSQVMGANEEEEAPPAPAPAPPPPAQQAPAAPPAAPQPAAAPPPQQQPYAPPAAPQQPYPQQPYPPQQQPAAQPQQQWAPPPEGGYPPPYGYMPYGYQPYPPQMMYPGYPQQPQGVVRHGESVSVQNAQFPNFSDQSGHVLGTPLTGQNMDLIMNVPLSVSVEIGKTKRKIKEILDFNQGTVIELEKQAGAPVDIVVNGQLIARGDVVVIDDNFGVRVTEIVGTKELIDSLENS